MGNRAGPPSFAQARRPRLPQARRPRYSPRCHRAACTPAQNLETFPRVNRLGINHDGYHGERIDIDAVLASIIAEAATRGWTRTDADAGPDARLPFLHRPARDGRDGPGFYISAGIHGDEPAGPLAVLELVRTDAFPRDANVWLCPCLNPTGFRNSTRENSDGVDLNRDYRDPTTREVRAHIAWLRGLPTLDLAVLLHEDWEASGFYLYELNPDGLPSLADAMIEAVRAVCPIDASATIDGRETHAHGIIRPRLDPLSRPQWPEAFWIHRNKARIGYTIEAPSDFPLAMRVKALVTAVRAAMDTVRSK